jgi:N-acetylglutamate synthase-like GNAT family acetyltransferase|tara:strand:- start:1105 stop:1590 length:486 start_codon:yes stop_codon:yes gene_type:complete
MDKDAIESSIIIDLFKEEYKLDFKALNLQWIKKYFRVEEEDRKILENPKSYVIDRGGQIFFAINDGKAIGTAAMVLVEESIFELSKMAVDPNYQGLGIGRRIVDECIKFAKYHKAQEIFLITNDKLLPALELYRSSGFELDENYDDNRYERGNTKMKLSLR